MPVKSKPRSRRAERAAATRARVIEAAAALFVELGYRSATIEAIAERADTSVETIYARFGNKAALLKAVVDRSVVGNDQGLDILDLPEIEEIRRTTDHVEQLTMLAAFSTGILSRVITTHRILQSAAASDATAAALLQQDLEYRLRGQRGYIDLLTANGPLRVDPDEAAATYSVLASPASYDFLTREKGWTKTRFESWLADSLTRLLVAQDTSPQR